MTNDVAAMTLVEYLRTQTGYDLEKTATKAACHIEALEAALMLWKCDSCGGAGIYRQPYSKAHPQGFEGPCTRCDKSGLHPIARKALLQSTPKGDGE